MITIVFAVLLGAAAAAAPDPTPTPVPSPTLPPLVSPEVHADRRVTFRLRGPSTAKEVLLSGEWGRERLPLAKDPGGDWSVTVGPIEPGLWGYSFIVDGYTMADPANAQFKLARSPRVSVVEVRGDHPRVDEWQDVPHGAVHAHTYASKSLGRPRNLVVYTPPGYEKDAARRFPALYLLHGSGDDERTWISLGHAHFILDNLIAEGKAQPMLLVMADGHPVYPTPPGVEGTLQNAQAFEHDLLADVIPFVESTYRVERNAAARGVAGVSMGGSHALLFGLDHSDVFSWVLGLSPGPFDAETTLAKALDDAKGTNTRLKMLLLACGKEDRLFAGTRELDELLTRKGVTHTFEPVEGGHNWPQWRHYLTILAPRLFSPPPAH